MTDTATFLPRLSHCPYCREQPDGEQYVDIAESKPLEDAVTIDKTPSFENATFDTTRCIRFTPCGHAFEEDSIDAITNALSELRKLRRERRKCEDARRLQEYDYEIEAQVHAVNNRVTEAVRRERASEGKKIDQ